MVASSLNDDSWRVGSVSPKPFGFVNDRAGAADWLPARVPGDVRLDLLRAGRIPDPFYGTDNEASQWVDDRDWWYVREQELTPVEGQRGFVILDGVDYQSAVFCDNLELGRHVGMFSRQVYELPSGGGHLAVRVWGSNALPRLRLRGRDHLLKFLDGRLFPDRFATLKCQMSFGWDFAPRLRTCGLWDDVWFAQAREVFIRELWVQAALDGRVRLTLSLDAGREIQLRARVAAHGKNLQSEPQVFEFGLRAARGRADYTLGFSLDAPHLWSPWDRGTPDLYELQVTLFDDAGECDSAVTTFGLRTIDLAPNPGAPPDEPPWRFIVNGSAEFIRGANWVPADAMPARLTRQDYADWLGLARAANINLLRVWGGGLREKRAFYDLCDEQGILVWQEFPFSGATVDYFPRSRAYLAFVRAEAGSIVRALRNHPSLALWCGGNEFNSANNAHIVNVLRAAVAEYDGTRPFKRTSPSPGDSHDWRVWHHGANTREYRQADTAFVSEFGLQAPPSAEALAGFLPAGELWPPSRAWAYHNAELAKLWRYARALNPAIDSLGEFVDAAQQAQLRGLQVMIEHARRHKPRISGCLFWQFDEPWPAICWSVVDYTRHPKPAYWKIQGLYNPVLISFDYPLLPRRPGDVVRGEVWLVNDTLGAIEGQLNGTLNRAQVLALNVAVEPDTAVRVGALELTLAEGANALCFELVTADRVASTNEYDLNYCDRGETTWLQARYSDAGAWLMQ